MYENNHAYRSEKFHNRARLIEPCVSSTGLFLVEKKQNSRFEKEG